MLEDEDRRAWEGAHDDTPCVAALRSVVLLLAEGHGERVVPSVDAAVQVGDAHVEEKADVRLNVFEVVSGFGGKSTNLC